MLFVLAWLLWLYRQPIYEKEKEEKWTGESSFEDFIVRPSGINRDTLSHKRMPIVKEEVLDIFTDLQEQVHLSDCDLAANKIKEAVLLRQRSVQLESGNNAFLVCGTNEFIVSEPFVEKRTAKLASQLSLNGEQANLFSRNSFFTPLRQERQLSNDHETSCLSIQVDNNGEVRKAPNEVSCYEEDFTQIQLQSGNHYHSRDGDNDEEREDIEVAQAFKKSEEEEEEDMQYTLPHGTKVSITHEAAGRIHSIVVKEKNPQPKTKPSKIRIASPRMRATSPRVRAENVSPTIISMKQEGINKEYDMVHLVVNTHQMDVNLSSREHIIVTEDVIPNPISANMVGSEKLDLQKKHGKLEQDIGKLPPHKIKRKDPNFLEKQTRKATDFDAIMNRRKKFVDTMDDAGRLLGQIAHRDEKISGGRRTLSKHWLKVKEAVRRRQYMNFKEKPMR